VRYLVAGGIAANLHGSVRATRDVDILVPRNLANTERLLAALGELPYHVARELAPEQVLSRPVTIVGDDPRVDVLTVAWTVTYEKAAPSRRARRIAGVRVPFLSLADLIASKRTGRAQDVADIEALEAIGVARKRTSARRPRKPVRRARG